MKQKLKIILSCILCCLVSLCSVLPSYAYPMSDPSTVYTKFVPSVSKDAVNLIKSTLKDAGYTLSDYKWGIFAKMRNSSELIFDFVTLPNDYSSFQFNSQGYLVGSTFSWHCPNAVRVTYDISGDTPSLAFKSNSGVHSDNFSKFSLAFSDASVYGYQPIASNCPITKNKEDITPNDPSLPPKPFIVTCSPKLGLNMRRTFTMNGMGINGEDLTMDNNHISVHVKLTDDFLEKSAVKSGSFVYSYQYTCFVIPSDYKNRDIRTMAEHSVYTCAQNFQNYLYYENETLDVDDSLSSEPATGDLASVSEQWANANGVTNISVLPRENDKPASHSVDIDLSNIDFASIGNGEADTYNVVVLGHIIRKTEYGWTAFPSYFKSSNPKLTDESYSSYPLTFGTDENPAECEDFYDYYTVISNDFNFVDYPEYAGPLTFKTSDKSLGNNGTITCGTSPLDFGNSPTGGIQDYDMHQQGGSDNTLKESDFKEYKKDKELNEQASSFNFDVGGLDDIFTQSGTFFKFLTASIGVLPTAFITILLAFFGVMLAICLVKWVL